MLSEQSTRVPGIVFFALLTALLGFGWLWAASRLGPDSIPTTRSELLAYARFIAPMFAVFGAGCFAVAVGLLLRHHWARYAALTCSGFWLLVGTLSFASMVFDVLARREMRGATTYAALVITAVFFVGLPASYWAYFFRRSIRALFTPRRKLLQPVGITVIAWWHVVMGVLMVPGLWLFRTPMAQILWVELRGGPALLVLLLKGGWSVGAGVGLLRRRAWGWWTAVTFQIFDLVQAIFTSMTPLRYEDVVAASRFPLPASSPEELARNQWMGVLPMAVMPVIFLALLWHYRSSFFNKPEPEPVSDSS